MFEALFILNEQDANSGLQTIQAADIMTADGLYQRGWEACLPLKKTKIKHQLFIFSDPRSV